MLPRGKECPRKELTMAKKRPDPKTEQAKAKKMQTLADVFKRAGEKATKVANEAKTLQREMGDMDKEDR
jgi:hypothetical protein